jgi:hypothetical protein
VLLATPALGQTDEPKGRGIQGQATAQESEAQTPAATLAKKKRKSARYYEAMCKSATDPKDRDLCQQWRMAEAANKQAKWTKRQFWATVAEIGALALTVLFTGWAAVAAGKASKAANKSVSVAEDTAKHELRAYFLYDVGQILDFPPNLRASARLIFKNYGQTPASELVMWTAIDILPFPLVEPLFKPEINELWSRAIVGPNGIVKKLQVLRRPLTAEEVGAVRGGQAAIYAWEIGASGVLPRARAVREVALQAGRGPRRRPAGEHVDLRARSYSNLRLSVRSDMAHRPASR